MELTAEQAKMLHAAAADSLATQNARLREIINEALVELMNYEDRPMTFVIRDAVKVLRRA
jgi:hypothetical protein